MRVFQYKVLNNILNQFDLPDYLWAFETGRGIPEMASMHVGKEAVISFDIKDYFTSITQKEIQDVLAKYHIIDTAGKLLSELCTYKYYVPQGALTSPKISNLITSHTFGPAIKQFCDERNLTMSVYADDITISSDARMTWEQIEEVRTFVAGALKEHGFKLNNKKTKVMFRGRRQYVCGAVVNDKVNLMRDQRLKLRAIVHNVVRNGVAVEAAKNDESEEFFLRKLKGKLNWYRQLNPSKGQALIDKLDTALEGASA